MKGKVKTEIIMGAEAKRFVLKEAVELVRMMKPKTEDMTAVYCAGKCKDSDTYFIVERHLKDDEWSVMTMDGEKADVLKIMNGFIEFMANGGTIAESRLVKIDMDGSGRN